MDSLTSLNETGLVAIALACLGLFSILTSRSWWQVRRGLLLLGWGVAILWTIADRAETGFSTAAAAILFVSVIGAIALRDTKPVANAEVVAARDESQRLA